MHGGNYAIISSPAVFQGFGDQQCIIAAFLGGAQPHILPICGAECWFGMASKVSNQINVPHPLVGIKTIPFCGLSIAPEIHRQLNDVYL